MTDIRRAVQVLVDLGLCSWDRIASLGSLGVSTAFNNVALDPASTYEEVFVSGLKLRHFNACLADYSYFQLSQGAGARWAFYPNPFRAASDLAELIDDPTDFGAFELSELTATASRSALRYDLAPDAYVPCRHGYAHLHFGHGEVGRITCGRRLSAESFCLLVSRIYFPEAWAGFDVEAAPAGMDPKNRMDSRLMDALRGTGFGDAEFSQLEALLPHFR